MKVFVWESHGVVSVHSIATDADKEKLIAELLAVIQHVDSRTELKLEGKSVSKRLQMVLLRVGEIVDDWGSDSFDSQTGLYTLEGAN